MVGRNVLSIFALKIACTSTSLNTQMLARQGVTDFLQRLCKRKIDFGIDFVHSASCHMGGRIPAEPMVKQIEVYQNPREPRDMQQTIHLETHARETLVDITQQVESVVRTSGIRQGIVSVYAQGATAAVMIQENWDESVQTDVINLLRKMIPQGVWLHDAQDGNGDAHLKAGLVGPSETVPLVDGVMGLSRWQNIFFCEFDGPRSDRRVVCSILEDAG